MSQTEPRGARALRFNTNQSATRKESHLMNRQYELARVIHAERLARGIARIRNFGGRISVDDRFEILSHPPREPLSHRNAQ